ncbi:aldehyde dehydrogenase family protein [Serratia ureilytica]|uniref:aldehyde dehydrogenase family protein n=1 Tax=Serratia ureilytica TaxID=300181 RepID=UPI001D18ADD8|nr:aldehyde dehydrogenase family protein [Serratia ureilytica]MCC4106505.1 aldehyde dehydrogenase family protein [Serratia ureilytica]
MTDEILIPRTESPDGVNTVLIGRWWQTHHALLQRTQAAIDSGEEWKPFSDSLDDYGEQQRTAGKQAFSALLGKKFPLHHRDLITGVTEQGWWASERSPYGFDLQIEYPELEMTATFERAEAALSAWGNTPTYLRAAILLEALQRLHQATFLFTEIGIHTSGHSYLMGFHASALHAQYRALEAITRAFQAQTGINRQSTWEVSVGDGPAMGFRRHFSSCPLGVNLIIGGRIVPTWNIYPALFASLMAGNTVIVKPHPAATLPIAVTVNILKDVLAEAGLPTSTIAMMIDGASPDKAKKLAAHKAVKIIDYIGQPEMGRWLEKNIHHALVFTQKSAITPVIIESTSHYAGMINNIAFGICSYSSQLCTSPRVFYLPKKGIKTPDGVIDTARLISDITDRINAILYDAGSPKTVLGALTDKEMVQALKDANAGIFGQPVLLARKQPDKQYPGAQVWSPALVLLDAEGIAAHQHIPPAGPIAFFIQTSDHAASLTHVETLAMSYGSLSIGIYTLSQEAERQAIGLSERVGSLLSINFSGNYYLSQSSVFSDLHGSIVNPSSNSGYTDKSYFSSRFRQVEHRKQLY